MRHLLLLVLLAACASARRQTLPVTNDKRPYFIVSSFGLLQGGSITITMSHFTSVGDIKAAGFSIHRSSEESTQYNLNQNQYSCILSSAAAVDENTALVPLDLSTGKFSAPLNNITAATIIFPDDVGGNDDNSTVMEISVDSNELEDIYTVAFHVCSENAQQPASVDMTLYIVEVNPGPEYLGAGVSALPKVYFSMCAVFGALVIVWMIVLRRCRDSPNLNKVHWLMLVLVICKFLSLLFHAIDYHYISINGVPMEGWAIPYYIFYFTRGILLFVTVLLIGAGFGFIKHALSDREKKLIIFVLSLQVVSNVSFIVMEETNEGSSQRTTWRSVGLLVDLACCAAILFPVIWSIRHLRESSQIDGKAHISLQKLRLFRRFYVMVLAFIYSTRIVVYLIESTIPFRYTWTAALLDELLTIAFYVATGYMFSPQPDNQYFQLPPSEEDEAMPLNDIVTTTGATEGLRNTKGEVRETTLRNYRKAQQQPRPVLEDSD